MTMQAAIAPSMSEDLRTVPGFPGLDATKRRTTPLWETRRAMRRECLWPWRVLLQR
jgi:hypothetical protein